MQWTSNITKYIRVRYPYVKAVTYGLPHTHTNTHTHTHTHIYIYISHPISQNVIFFEEKISMQQGQADILIARFPDPSYGVKTVNFIINSPHLS